MSKTHSDIVATALDEALPDASVLEELLMELSRCTEPGGSARVLVDGATMTLPTDVKLTLVEKALFKEAHETFFPAGCRVDVALGETQRDGLGLLVPAYCFARLFFDLECRCTRIEFRSTIYRFSDD
jgi:hypothetical protein